MSEDIKALLQELLASGPFHEFLNMELLGYDAEAGMVEIRLPWRREFERLPDTGQWAQIGSIDRGRVAFGRRRPGPAWFHCGG